MEFTIKELEKIISSGDFNPMIGKIENDFFDCKSQIYDLKNEYSKRELAKDVSSFANLNGGYILIGLKTEDSKTHFGEEIKEINFIDKILVNTGQYNNVINDWIYPKVDGTEVKWITTGESVKGVLIIKIPLQEDIHRAIRDGLLYDKNIENRFNNLESVIQPLFKKRHEEEQKNKNEYIINERVNKILQSYGDDGK